MGIIVKKQIVSDAEAQRLQKLCPFGAIEYNDGKISINSACKACKICAKKDVDGIVAWQDEEKRTVDKSLWTGVAVYAQLSDGKLHPVTLELLGKARELSAVIGQKVTDSRQRKG